MTTEESAAIDTEGSSKARHVRLLALLTLGGTGMAALYHFVLRFYFGLPYPWNSFLYIPSDRFMDFFNDYLRAQAFLDGTSSVITYTPFSHLFMTALTALPATMAFIAVIAVFVATLLYMFWRFYLNTPGMTPASRSLWALALAAMSYPVIFAIDRGNQEMLVFVLMFWFVYFYYVKKRPWVAVVFLAVAAALKIYPAVFVVLLLADRRFRESAAVVAGVVGAWLASALALGIASGRGFAFVVDATLQTLGAGGHSTYMLELYSAGHRHSLWNVLTLWHWVSGREQTLSGLVKPYMVGALLIFLAISLWVIFIEKEQWRRFGLLTIAMLLLPYLSGVYNVPVLYLPLMLLVTSRRPSRYATAYTILFALMFVPLDYFIIISDVSSGTVLSALIMVVIAILMVVERIAERAGVASHAGQSEVPPA